MFNLSLSSYLAHQKKIELTKKEEVVFKKFESF
jgi:hypothetical protein